MATPKDLVLDEDIVASRSDSDLLVDSVPRRYNLIKKYMSIIEENLPKKEYKLLKFIADYRNKYSNILDTPYPIDYPPWKAANKDIIFSSCGIDEKEFTDTCSRIEGVNGFLDSYMKDKSQLLLMLLMYRYYHMNKNERMKKVLSYYMGYGYYWMAFTNSFKKYKPNKDMMEYTVNNMTYKFILRKTGSVNELIYHGINSVCTTYINRIVRGSDFEFLYISDKIKDRFKIYMKSIYQAHDKTVKDKAIVLNAKDKHDDNKLRDMDGGINSVSAMAEKYTAKFMANPVVDKIIDFAAKSHTNRGVVLIPKKDLRNCINIILDDKDNIQDVRRLFESLFYIYSIEEGYDINTVSSIKFTSVMMNMYKAGNSNDENRIFIKEILDKWLTIGSVTYRSSNREGTINNFRRAIYNYFIYRISIG